MKLIYITDKSIDKKQLKQLHYLYNNKSNTEYLHTHNWPYEKILKNLSKKNSYNYLIAEKNLILGHLTLKRKRSYSYLTIVIDNKYWGKGYGTRAMRLAEIETKKMKLKRIKLGLYKKNKRAYNLYKSLNYVITKEDKKIVEMESYITLYR